MPGNSAAGLSQHEKASQSGRRTIEDWRAGPMYGLSGKGKDAMRSRDLSTWMWGDAISLLEQAERLHRQFFRAAGGDTRAWEPPVDVVEDDTSLVVHVALPGVPATAVTVDFQPGAITVTGVRCLPAQQAAQIHRIEIPYGRFERRIPLPVRSLGPAQRQLIDGCLLITFRKMREVP
jgi:HSP20 family molecular chaperone IbpA